MGKIPILRDADVVVPDSSVICAYLEKKHPSPALYPAEPADLAKALFLEEYADTRVFEVLGPILFERVVKRFVLKQEPDEARVADLLARELPPVLDYLESQLPGDGDSVLTRFGIADAALGAAREPDLRRDRDRRPALAPHRALPRGAPGAPLVQDRHGAVGPWPRRWPCNTHCSSTIRRTR
jgi:glutathione S-transferase